MKKHRNCRFVVLIIAFSILFSSSFAEDTLEILSPNFFGEEDNIFDEIHYLENEYLSFNFCTSPNSSEMSFELYCDIDNNTELPIFTDTNNEGCFFSNYDMDKVSCDDFDLLIKYQTNNIDKIIKRSFTKEKESKLINFVLSLDYNLLTPDDLSYYLIVLNNVEDLGSKLSTESYDKLKNDRDNSNKCWPSGDCTVERTSKILRNLQLANYDLQTRLLEDGKNYIEKKLINNENNPLEFVVFVDNDLDDDEQVTCGLTIDSGTEKNYDFDENDTSVTKFASESISFTCNETIEEIRFTLYNIEDKVVFSEEYEDSTSFTYEIDDFSCVGEDTACAYTPTIDSLNAFGSEIDTYAELINYIESLVAEDDDGTKSLDVTDPYESSGKYLYQHADDNIEEYLTFNQNNDGSWGDDSKYDRVVETSWAVLGLQQAQATAEYVSDGKKWIYFNEPEAGWGDVEKNALAYLAIKEQIKPYLDIKTVNEIQETTYFTITNPTIFNIRDIKLELSEEIEDSVLYLENLGDLDGEQSLEFNLTLNENFFGVQTGEIKITGVDGKKNEIELARFPVNLQGPVAINILGGEYYVTDDNPNVELQIEKILDEYSVECNYINPFTLEEESVGINQNHDEISIPNKALGSGNFSVEINCVFAESGFTIPVDISVQVAKKTFDLEKKEIILTDTEDFSFKIKSLHDEMQTVKVTIGGDYAGGIIESAEVSKIIAADDERELFIEVKNPSFLEALGNTSKGTILVKSDTGYAQSIDISANIDNTPKQTPKWIKWVLIIVMILILFFGFVGFRLYQLRDYDDRVQAQQEADDEEFYIE